MNEDEAVILEDLGDGYLVLQESERVASYGAGHFVQDIEVELIEMPSAGYGAEAGMLLAA